MTLSLSSHHVHEWEQDQPDKVDHVPVAGTALDTHVIGPAVATAPRLQRHRGQDHHPGDHVQKMPRSAHR